MKKIVSKKRLIAIKCIGLFLLFCNTVFAQTKTVTGTVVDEKTGDGIANVSIIIKSTGIGTSTDSKGIFSLAVVENEILNISSVGYKSISIPVDVNAPMVIKLFVTNQQQADVVVIGYGTKKRSDITGSVASVSKERLSQLPVTNALQAIQGSVSGVSISQSSSAPGAGASTTIRGAGSLAASTEPFIVLDGIPFVGGSINDINPSDIASIDILKDVSSTAIYGTRGANGVILITTKKGRTGKASVTYNFYTGNEGFAHKVEPMSAAQYVQKYTDWKTQSGSTSTAILPNAFEQSNYASNTSTNWLDKISQTGSIQNHTLSVSGGNKDVKYYVSGDYLKEKGILQGFQFNRYSIRSNIDATITNYLTTGLNLSFTNNNYDGGRVNLTGAGAVSPYGTYLRSDGNYEIYPMFGELLYTSPMLGTKTTRNERTKNISANIFAELTPTFIKGLKYKITVGSNYVPTLFQSYIGRNAGNLIGLAQINNSETKSWIVDNLVTYEKNIAKNHIDVTALYSAEQRKFNSSSITASGFINDIIEFNNFSTATTVASNPNFGGLPFAWQTTNNSKMLRLNYTYDSRYLFTATYRQDGSSVFGSNTSKLGSFPSVAVGWNVTKEKFMENVNWLNNLKLRFAYGLAGNQAIPAYGTISTFATTTSPYNGLSTVGLVADVLGNNNLKWERTYGSNFGIDFSILQNKITGSIETYKTHSKDLLIYRSLPTITGYTKVLDNLGLVSNTGIEFSIKTQNLAMNNFKWESNINFSSNRNRIEDLYGDKKDDVGNRLFIGKPIGVVYDYRLVGVWQTGESPASQDPTAKPGDLKFADIDGNKTITANDRVILGQTAPKWIGGLTNTFHFKNLHLNIFVQTAQGITKNNSLMDFRDLGGRQNLPAEVSYWTATNGNNTRPSLTYNNSRLYGYASDASYTRLKDVTLSYSLSKTLMEKLKIGGGTFYLSGRNLATWTKWVGWDPEVDFDRGNFGATNTTGTNLSYPLVRSFIIGANITLR
jgi:TonB-linked SusC/RagA family outer membrane protein